MRRLLPISTRTYIRSMYVRMYIHTYIYLMQQGP